MSMTSKKVSMAPLAFVLLLTACGKSGEGDAVKQPSETPSAPAEIIFYGGSTQPQDFFDRQYGELLYKKFPQHTFKYIQMPVGNIQEGTTKLLTEGQRFDIFYNNIGIFENTLFSAGLQYDMTELMKKHNVDLSRLEQESIHAMKQFSAGKTYGVPVTDMKFVLFYNKDIFDKFGVPYRRTA